MKDVTAMVEESAKSLATCVGAGCQYACLQSYSLSPLRWEKGRGRLQCTHLGDTSDVLVTVLLAKAQVLVQPEAHIVSVESVYSQTLLQEVLLESDGDGGLSGGGQTGEPEGETLLLAELIALGARERCVPCDVAVGWEEESVRDHLHDRYGLLRA